MGQVNEAAGELDIHAPPTPLTSDLNTRIFMPETSWVWFVVRVSFAAFSMHEGWASHDDLRGQMEALPSWVAPICLLFTFVIGASIRAES
jgi:hypothetical protein